MSTSRQDLLAAASSAITARWILEQLEPRMLMSAASVCATFADVAPLLAGMNQSDDPENHSDALRELARRMDEDEQESKDDRPMAPTEEPLDHTRAEIERDGDAR